MSLCARVHVQVCKVIKECMDTLANSQVSTYATSLPVFSYSMWYCQRATVPPATTALTHLSCGASVPQPSAMSGAEIRCGAVD